MSPRTHFPSNWNKPSAVLFCAGALVLVLVQGCSSPGDEWPVEQASWAVHEVCGGPDTVEGIDVSKWNETVNWQSVKADGIVFAIARVSDGLNYPDAYFSGNWTGMKQAGIVRGVYQYFRPSQDPVAQANYMVQEVQNAGGLEAGDLPPVLDLENAEGMSSDAILAKVDQWLDTIKHAFNRIPIIYTGSYFWDENIFSDSYASYPLWIPHYTSNPCPKVADPWQEWKIWQYTDSASVAGVSGNVDANRFNGTQADLQAFIASTVINPLPPDAGPPPSDSGVIRDGGIAAQDLGTPWVDGGGPWPDGLPPSTTYDEERPSEGGCSLTGGGEHAGAPTAVALVLMALLFGLGRRGRKRL